jgi:hypothetical protein
MRRSSSLRGRVKEIEEARGAHGLSLTLSDGSRNGFYLERNDCLEVLLASFHLARAARNPAVEPHSNPRAIEVAKQIGMAEQVSPHSALWDSVAAIVRGAEEDARNSHAPAPASS